MQIFKRNYLKNKSNNFIFFDTLEIAISNNSIKDEKLY